MAVCPHAHVTATKLADGDISVTCDVCNATLGTIAAAQATSSDAVIAQVTAIAPQSSLVFPFLSGRGW